MSPALSRRRFAQATIAAGAALGFPAVLSARNPNDKLSIAIVGATPRSLPHAPSAPFAPTARCTSCTVRSSSTSMNTSMDAPSLAGFSRAS